MKYSSTFVFQIKELDSEFERLNDEIADRARKLQGFLGEEAWHDEEAGLYSEVYYWSDMKSLRQLVSMDTHGVAKSRYDNWLGEYRVVIAEIVAVYGNPSLGLEHVPETSNAQTSPDPAGSGGIGSAPDRSDDQMGRR